MLPELADIAEAITTDPGGTPRTVLDAFLPQHPTVLGSKLRPVSIGTWMCLEKIGHPFVTGMGVETLSPYDIVCAFYILTTDTKTIFAALGDGSFRDAVLIFADQIPFGELGASLHIMQEHFANGISAAMPMSSPHDTAQKKTAASVGSSPC